MGGQKREWKEKEKSKQNEDCSYDTLLIHIIENYYFFIIISFPFLRDTKYKWKIKYRIGEFRSSSK